MEYRPVGMIPATAEVEEQEPLKTEPLEPVLEEARTGKRVVYLVEAAHFVLTAFLGYLWRFGRLLVRAPAGRKRVHV